MFQDNPPCISVMTPFIGQYWLEANQRLIFQRLYSAVNHKLYIYVYICRYIYYTAKIDAQVSKLQRQERMNRFVFVFTENL